jgi:hypothetical protein
VNVLAGLRLSRFGRESALLDIGGHSNSPGCPASCSFKLCSMPPLPLLLEIDAADHVRRQTDLLG